MSTYDEFKEKHPAELLRAEAELEVTEEMARLRAELANEKKVIRILLDLVPPGTCVDDSWVESTVIFTTDQINKAWAEANEGDEYDHHHPLLILDTLGIVACPKCDGAKVREVFDGGGMDLYDCNCPNNGWVLEVSDE